MEKKKILGYQTKLTNNLEASITDFDAKKKKVNGGRRHLIFKVVRRRCNSGAKHFQTGWFPTRSDRRWH